MCCLFKTFRGTYALSSRCIVEDLCSKDESVALKAGERSTNSNGKERLKYDANEHEF